MSWFALLSYGVAALAYAATGIILFSSLPRERQAVVLASAVGASSLWAATIFVLLVNDAASIFVLVTLDAAHLTVWIACALSWLSSPVSARLWLVMPLAGVAVWLAVVGSPLVPSVDRWVLYPALVALALVGFLAVEQIYRNATREQRSPLAWLCVAIGGVFAIDLFVYSQATLLRAWLPVFWDARGFANTMLLPLLMIAAKRQSKWARELFVSRQVVFYTASLLGVGTYLLVMALLGYVIRAIGGQWTFALAMLFLTVAAAVLLFVLFSSTIRARFRVLLVKHFYRHKYEYREEWLRLTQRLGRRGDSQLLAADGLEALALIIGSRSGHLWISRDEDRYEWMASLGANDGDRTLTY
jgi:putative PEP-CTERM system histidine kinase